MPKLHIDYLSAAYQAIFEIEHAASLGFDEAYRAESVRDNWLDVEIRETFRRISNDMTDLRYLIEKHEPLAANAQNRGLEQNRIRRFDAIRQAKRAAKEKAR
jgi:hypothetical protein